MKRNSIKQLLMSSNYYVLNKKLIRSLGIETAFFLSALVEADEMLADDTGWFYQTSKALEDMTGLSNHKQSKCIEQLKDLGVLLQENRGLPCKRYFKIDYDKVDEILNTEILNTTVEENQKQDFKNFEVEFSKNLKTGFENSLNNKELNNKKLNKELIDDDDQKGQSTSSQQVEFKNKILELRNLAINSTGLSMVHVESLIKPYIYKEIDFDLFLKKIKASDFLMGKTKEKPTMFHFATKKGIDLVMADVYKNKSSSMNNDISGIDYGVDDETEKLYKSLGL